jgi:hypothetical protein
MNYRRPARPASARPLTLVLLMGKIPSERLAGPVPSARVAAPASRNSLTRRSCNVLFARSTRPFAGLESPVRFDAGRRLYRSMALALTCPAGLASGQSCSARHMFASAYNQSAGRVVDKHQQGALRSAILKPPIARSTSFPAIRYAGKAAAACSGVISATASMRRLYPRRRHSASA